MNMTIHNYKIENITLFLGAGASLEFVRGNVNSTNAITQYILKQIKTLDFKDFIYELTSSHFDNGGVPFDEKFLTAQDYILTLFELIKEIIGDDNVNFETYIETIDQLATFSETEIETNFTTSITRIIERLQRISIDFINPQNTDQISKQINPSKIDYNHYDEHSLRILLRAYPFAIRYFILKRFVNIEKDYYAIDCNMIHSLDKFINYTLEISENTSIISLNYDSFFWNVVKTKKFNHGFEEKFPNINRLIDIKRNIIYPHGSIHFNFKDRLNIEWEENHEYILKNFIEMCKTQFNYLEDPGNDGKKINYNLSIVSGLDKSILHSVMPYDLHFTFACKQIMNNNNLIICIGYSGADEHFNSFIKTSSENLSNKTLIIDYCTDLDKYSRHELLNKIGFSHSKGISPDKGFTYLLMPSDNKNIFFYRLGFKEFLNNYKYIMDMILK